MKQKFTTEFAFPFDISPAFSLYFYQTNMAVLELSIHINAVLVSLQLHLMHSFNIVFMQVVVNVVKLELANVNTNRRHTLKMSVSVIHAPISYLRHTNSRHNPAYFSEGEICLKICNLNKMKSRQERNLQHFQNQIKLQFSSINCQFKITLRLEQCFVRVNGPQRTHPFSV